MVRTVLLAFALAGLLVLVTANAGGSADPDGARVTTDAGNMADPNGAAATVDAGGHFDPNG